MDEIILLVEEAPEGGYTARALGQSIFTESDDLDGLREMVRDAVRCHFDDGQGPRMISLRVGRGVLELALRNRDVRRGNDDESAKQAVD